MDGRQLVSLQEKLGYTFVNPDLLKNALAHSSYANASDSSGTSSNERLEFLGDSLLGMTVALLIYERRSDLTEGQMTKLRAGLVCEHSLAEVAAELDLGDYLLLGRGEIQGGGRGRPSILSDALEAVIAAMYLDGGFEPIKRFITACFVRRIEQPVLSNSDYKTLLQEMIQINAEKVISYAVIDEHGPDHDKSFVVEVRINDKPFGVGVGKSKKSAQQEAAKAAIEAIGQRSEKSKSSI